MKKELLQDYKEDIGLLECWTVEQFAKLKVGYSQAYIREQMALPVESGGIRNFQPKGRDHPKITRAALYEWFENNSFSGNQELQLVKGRR